jgi:serine/threonine protein kinase
MEGTHPSADAILRFVTGAAPESLRKRIEAHLDNCSSCRLLFSEFVRTSPPGKRQGAAGLSRSNGRDPAQEARTESIDDTLRDDSRILERTVDPLIGAKLGEYVITRRIGTGGMGVVYEASQPVIGGRVAIKVLRRDLVEDPLHVQRLLSEARAVNAVRHRGIIDIFGFGTTKDGRQYVVMEYLEGRGLDEVIAQRAPLAPHEALEILDEILDALEAAHSKGVIHRDVKPSNVFTVSVSRGPPYAMLLDFGLSKRSGTPRQMTAQSMPDFFIGTPEYIAPEQALGRPVGPQTDLYSAGAVAFEMLTGRPPFKGKEMLDTVKLHLKAPPPAPSSVVPRIPEIIDRWVQRLMAKSPRRRPTSAAEARAELRQLRSTLHALPTEPGTEPRGPVTKGGPLAGGRRMTSSHARPAAEPRGAPRSRRP